MTHTQDSLDSFLFSPVRGEPKVPRSTEPNAITFQPKMCFLRQVKETNNKQSIGRTRARQAHHNTCIIQATINNHVTSITQTSHPPSASQIPTRKQNKTNTHTTVLNAQPTQTTYRQTSHYKNNHWFVSLHLLYSLPVRSSPLMFPYLTYIKVNAPRLKKKQTQPQSSAAQLIPNLSTTFHTQHSTHTRPPRPWLGPSKPSLF